MGFSVLAKSSTEWDLAAVALRSAYFGGGPETVEELPIEAVFFWRRVAKMQKLSGLSPVDYIRVQTDWFDENDVDYMTPEAVESLGNEQAYKRARNAASGISQRDDAGLNRVTEDKADQARKLYEHYKRTYFPKDNRTINPKSDVWKRIFLTSEKSNETLDAFVHACFKYSVTNRLKPPTPQLLASKDALQRSAEMNRTILEGPKK